MSMSSALHSGSSAFAAGRGRQPRNARPAARPLRLRATAAAQVCVGLLFTCSHPAAAAVRPLGSRDRAVHSLFDY